MDRLLGIFVLVLLGLTACGGGTPAPTATAVPPVTGPARGPGQPPTPGLAGADREDVSPTADGTLTTSTPTATSTTVVAVPTPTPSEGASIPGSPAEQPTPLVPPFDFQEVTVTGLIATVPGYARLDAGEVARLVERVYPGRVPTSVQALVVLTEDDQAHLVLALDTEIDRFITAGTVVGLSAPPLENLPVGMDFTRSVIVSDDVTLMEAIRATPDQVNRDPSIYAFKRVAMDTVYLLASIRINDAPPSLGHIGFGLAADGLGSQSRDDYLAVIDPYNTEAQIRVASLTGTVLFPTQGLRHLLGQVYRFTADDLEEALGRPSVFYESLEDDEPQLLNISSLVPTPQDPALKLHNYHGDMISIQGIALGAMVRTEDIPILRNIPVGLTAKVIGVADLTGAMPIVGISTEDVSGEVFGFFRFDLSVYSFGDQAAYAFLVNKETVVLDPVAEVARAQFGDRVAATLRGYTVVESDRIQLSENLTLEQVDWLMPTEPDDPVIMTRHDGLTTGDYLDSVTFDGYMLDGRILGIPQPVPFDEPKTLVVKAAELSFVKGVPPIHEPTGVPTPGFSAPRGAPSPSE